MYQVLIVDDEPAVTHSLAEHVEWDSFEMVLAATACGASVPAPHPTICSAVPQEQARTVRLAHPQ